MARSCGEMDIMLTVCYYHVTHAFQSESTLYSWPECQGTLCSKQARYLKFTWQQRDSNPPPLSSSTSTHPFLSTHSTIFQNGWVFLYELSRCGFESCCCHLDIMLFFILFLARKGSLLRKCQQAWSRAIYSQSAQGNRANSRKWVGEKLPMLVIRKAEKLRCFKGVKSLPCQYKSQKKSWMDSEIFSDYARRLDAKFQVEGTKVSL